jgi:AraC-like DNA-binding protein
MSGGEMAAPAEPSYREYPPPPALAEHLVCIWTQVVPRGAEPFTHRVLPDGCIDIVLINEETPLIAGPWTEPFTVSFAPGTAVVGARWYPGRASSLLRLNAAALLNQSVALGDVWSRTSRAPIEQIAGEPTLAARRVALETALLGRLGRAAPADGAMRAAVRWLARHPQGRVGQLSEWLGISGRQLQRRFAAAVGYGPKQFQSVLRFQRLLGLASHTPGPRTLGQLSAAAGYADQAHMTREFQRFAGRTPSQMLRAADSALALSDLLDAPGVLPGRS